MNIRKSSLFILFALIICAIVGALGFIFYELYYLKQQSVVPAAAPVRTQRQPETQVIEKLVSKSEVWRPIQDNIKDTVVQVFSQIAEFDFLQPYRSPGQFSATGTAFFINDKGDLITNAHVVNQAKAIWIQLPSLGKRIIDVDVIGVSPERDLALLRVKPNDLTFIRQELGSVPFLSLGDSDLVRRSDEVLALGYPLSQQSLKSTTGVISGREQEFIQMSAPINPGNSGGPLLNINGEVIGVNTANVPGAQNVGYIIPINDLKIILPDLYKVPLLRKPFLGVLFNNASESLTEYLGNPHPGGCYVVEVVKGSTLYKAGVKPGDMLYEINGHRIDLYGEMSVPWSEDRISLIHYVARLSIGEDVRLVVYRKGERKELSVKFSQAELPPIHKVYPGFEDIDFEVFGGMVVMPLTINHIQGLAKNVPGLARFSELQNQKHPVLIITHVFPTSQLYRARTITPGATINAINGQEVHTLEDFRQALRDAMSKKFLTIKVSDNFARTSDNVLVVLPFNDVLEEEARLSQDFRYALTPLAKQLIAAHEQNSEGRK